MNNIIVEGKYGKLENFQLEKIHRAIKKSANRVFVNLSEADCFNVISWVYYSIKNDKITV